MVNRPCPKCVAIGRDKTGDHLYLMKDGKTWTCARSHHPRYFEVDGEATQPTLISRQTAAFVEAELKFISLLGSSKLSDRGLKASSVAFFGIKTEHSEETGEVVAHYYPQTDQQKVTGYKKRSLPKTFTIIGTAGSELFGQCLFRPGGKAILIAGGELDAASAFQMLTEKYQTMDTAFVSPTNGENLSSIKRNREYINSFTAIYVAADMDDAGRTFAKGVVDLFGWEKTLVMQLPAKDVNDCLTQDKQKEFISAYFSAGRYKPNGIATIGDISDDALKPTEWGLSYPWPALTNKTFGMRPQSVIGIGGGPGVGKTSFISQIQRHLVFAHKQKVGIFSLEETPGWSTKKLIGSIMNKPIHLPDCLYSVEEAQKIKEELRDRVYFFDHLDYHGWDDIKNAIRYFYSEGVRWFFIDPLSALHAHLNASEANTFLSGIMVDFETLAKTLDVTFFHINHLNNPTTGKDHGAGGRVYGGQFSGSRAMWKYSTGLFGLERDQLAEEDRHRSIVRCVVLKDRLSGQTGEVLLYYNKDTGNIEEYQDFE